MFLSLKKYWLLVFLSLVLVFLVVIKFVFLPFLSRQEPATVFLPKPSLAPIPEAPQNLSYSFEKDLPFFPKTLPIYKIVQTPASSLPGAKKLAKDFGFETEPQISNDIDAGVFYNWADDSKHLSVGGKPAVIIFGQPSLKQIDSKAVVLPSKTAAQTAEKILKEKGLDNPLLDLTNPQIIYLQINNGSLKTVRSPQEAQIIRIGYSYKIDSFPLLGNTPSSPAVFLLLDPKGELLKLIYTKYPVNFEKGREVKIINNEEIKKRLANREGIILYSLSEEDLESESPPAYQVGLVKISRAYLAYYYPPGGGVEIIQPVFVFEGEAVDRASGKTVKTMTFLPAAENLQP